jgi:hypothetical protein
VLVAAHFSTWSAIKVTADGNNSQILVVILITNYTSCITVNKSVLTENSVAGNHANNSSENVKKYQLSFLLRAE